MRVLACVAAAVAVAGTASAGAREVSRCPPLGGTVLYVRAGEVHAIALDSCIDRVVGAAPAPGLPAGVTTGSRASRQRIVFDGRTIWSQQANGPVVVLSLSPSRRWLVFAVDPLASASIMADGLQAQVLSTHGGPAHPLGLMLAYPDYLTWCGDTLVYAQGGDRIAVHAKRLVRAAAPGWRPRTLWDDATRSFASPSCGPDGESVAVLSQRSGTDARFFATRWQIWDVTLAGAHRLLDAPPAGYADESPTWSPAGDALLFVRERQGYGTLVIANRGIHPIAPLGYSLGYYGHHDWGLAWRR